jgi:pyrroloquinoline quinone (PQQ) biosynthesis protein C
LPFSRATALKARLLMLLKLSEENSFLRQRIYYYFRKDSSQIQNDQTFSLNIITKLDNDKKLRSIGGQNERKFKDI